MSKRILIVDDSATVRQVLKMTLENCGYEVLEAVDGHVALDSLAKSQIDMVMTDLHMPNLDGLALIREIRKGANNSSVPIVVLTTDSSTDKKAEGKAAGISGWVVKPFLPEQIVNVVRTICPL